MVGAIFEGVGVSSGSAIGGRLFDSIGGSKTFKYFGIAAFGFFVIHVVLQFVISKFSDPHGKERITHSKANLNNKETDDDDANNVKENFNLNNEINTNNKKVLGMNNGDFDNDGFKEVDLKN